ncbi:hypothetical protein [Haloterrigena sp. H1]|nr:hypothetical protein [Haloterrigena sp. H1]
MNGPEDSDPITGVPIDDPDVPVYMPGTPTGSFLRFIERAVDMLWR